MGYTVPVPHDSEELRRLEAETRSEIQVGLPPGSVQVPSLTVLYHLLV